MISNADFIKIPFSPDLTESGIAYATRSLTRSFDHLGGSTHSRMLRYVSGVSVELAFRRYLNEKEIPFDVKGALPFSEPDRYDVTLGRHRCDLHTFLISKRNQISVTRRDSAVLLKEPALLREEQFSSSNHTENDLHIFAFLLGLTTNSPEDMRKAKENEQSMYLVHPLHSNWSHPQGWVSLGKLALKSECTTPVIIEIGGQDGDRNFTTETLTLEPRTRTFALNNYYSLAYIHINTPPDARIGLQSTGKRDIYLIQQHEWSNIWIYGLEILLAGYITQSEFRRKASTTFTGSRVFQYSTTQTKKLSVPVSDLRPLENLFEQVKKWSAENKSW